MDLLTESVKKVGRGMGHIHFTSPCMKLLMKTKKEHIPMGLAHWLPLIGQ